MRDLVVVSAVNEHSVLEDNLLRSPDICSDEVRVEAVSGFSCLGMAANHAMEGRGSGVCVLAHQDVYFPAGWFERLSA